MVNKKIITIAVVLIVALFVGITIGYSVKSNIRNSQIYEKYNIVNTASSNTTKEHKP